MPHRSDLPRYYNFCKNSVENIIHFLGSCLKLRNIRYKYFNKYELGENEILELMNGQQWNLLYKFYKEAYLYRSKVISEVSENQS